MKFLFNAGGSQATVFAVAPLAAAARNAGHEILLAADEPLMATAEAIGIPAACVTRDPIKHGTDAAGADERLNALLDLAADWPPDLVIGGLSYVPGLLAARLKVPFVRHAWVPRPGMEARLEQELRPVLDRLGLAGLPRPDLFIDVCPPSLRSVDVPGARSMRWIPRNRQRRLERWMYARTDGRRRVLITSGTRTLMLNTADGTMRGLVDQLSAEGAEVLIAAPDEVARQYAAELPDVRIGWIPLDVVAPTLDLAVHHGGATTAMTIVSAGVPHLVIPDNGYGQAVGQALAGAGAARLLEPELLSGQDAAELIGAGCREVLSTPRYAQRAGILAAEIGTLPTPDQVVVGLETLAAQ